MEALKKYEAQAENWKAAKLSIVASQLSKVSISNSDDHFWKPISMLTTSDL